MISTKPLGGNPLHDAAFNGQAEEIHALLNEKGRVRNLVQGMKPQTTDDRGNGASGQEIDKVIETGARGVEINRPWPRETPISKGRNAMSDRHDGSAFFELRSPYSTLDDLVEFVALIQDPKSSEAVSDIEYSPNKLVGPTALGKLPMESVAFCNVSFSETRLSFLHTAMAVTDAMQPAPALRGGDG